MKLHRDPSTKKIIHKGGKLVGSGTASDACCCCAAATCDIDNLVDEIWPQYIQGTLTSVSTCTAGLCYGQGWPMFTATDVRYLKCNSANGEDGNLNTSYRMKLREWYSDDPASITPWAFYYCKLPAPLRMDVERHSASGCASPIDMDSSLYVGVRLIYSSTERSNYSEHSIAASPTGAVRTSNVVTITTATPHTRSIGDSVVVEGVTSAGGTDFNGAFNIASVPSSTSFTYAQTAANDTGGGGTMNGPHVTTLSPYVFVNRNTEAPTIADPFDPPNSLKFWNPRWVFFYNTGATSNQTPWQKSFVQNTNQFTCPGAFSAVGRVTVTPCNLL